MAEDNNSLPIRKQTKISIVLPAIAIVTSFYYSFSFTFGVVIGYVLCKLFCILFLHNGKVDKVFLDFGKWKIHLHHWMMGIILLAVVWVIDYYYLPTLFAGFVCGIIIQDIYDYNDWHQIIVKKNKQEKTLAV
jgi:hypothetical protein